MSEKIQWNVVKPFMHDNKPYTGGTIALTRAQAEFLLIGGFLARRPVAADKPVKKKDDNK